MKNKKRLPGNKKTFVGPSRIHGNGIIAKRNIKKGEAVFIIKGKIVKFFVKSKKDAMCGPDWVGIDDNMWIDPTEPSRFLNHSCNPTCGVSGKVTIRALRNLKKGDEVTVDYSTIEAERMWAMPCYCKNKNCRKVIHSIQFLPTSIYKKYLPYVPNYFQKVYNKHHNLKQKNG